MKTFVLDREIDTTGVSGTGVIAEGVEFTNGKCVVSWKGKISSVVVYDSIEDVQAVHCHDGNTYVDWA